MARIRNIKPSFWTSGSNGKLSVAARLLFIGLWSEADDEGRLIASPKSLAGAIFPHDDDVTPRKVERWLAELIAADKVVRYETDGVAYLWVVNFTKHQRVHKPTPSTLPSPDLALFPSTETLENPRIPTGFPRGKGDGNGNGDGVRGRERNPIFDALVEIFGPASTTNRAGMYGKAASDLKAAGATSDDVLERGNRMLQKDWKDATPLALTKHWDALGVPTPPPVSPAHNGAPAGYFDRTAQ